MTSSEVKKSYCLFAEAGIILCNPHLHTILLLNKITHWNFEVSFQKTLYFLLSVANTIIDKIIAVNSASFLSFLNGNSGIIAILLVHMHKFLTSGRSV